MLTIYLHSVQRLQMMESVPLPPGCVYYYYYYYYYYYSLPNIVRVVKSRRMRWVGHVARMGEGRGVHRVLVGKPEGKRPLGRP